MNRKSSRIAELRKELNILCLVGVSQAVTLCVMAYIFFYNCQGGKIVARG